MAICDGQQDALRFILEPGGRIERDLFIENRSDEPITVSRVESSCDCLTLVTPLADLTFKPGERTQLRIAVDLSKDPKAMNGFAPYSSLHDGSARELATVNLDVEVRQP